MMLQLKNTCLFTILFAAVLTVSCSDNNGNEGGSSNDDLDLLTSFDIAIPEPSGLTVNDSGTALYTVSDNTAKVYKISTTGDVIKTYSYVGNDLEGVSIFTGSKLLLAEERTKEIVEFDMGSGIFLKHKIPYHNNDDNSGIEGVAYAENLDAIFILNEKNPGKLLRLRNDFSVLAEYELNFAKDYSGIFYDNLDKILWIVSDQNKTINKCSLKGDVLKSYSINITQAEGVAITNDKIYIISDAEAKLYIYKKPQN